MKHNTAKAIRLEPSRTSDPMDEFGIEGAHEERAPARPAAIAPVQAVSSRDAVVRGRWFVAAFVLGLLAIGQTPFVVLWALQFTGEAAASPSAGKTGQTSPSTPAPLPSAETASLATLPAAVPPARVTVVMPAPRGPVSGWVSFDMPVSLRVTENGELLGTTDVERLMLPAGEHVLDMSSDELHFRVQRTVTVNPGATTTLQLDLPRASLAINAKPWAETWVDGERVGETPIGNLLRPIGRHEVVLRHPRLGERREWVVLTLNQQARVSVDLREPN